MVCWRKFVRRGILTLLAALVLAGNPHLSAPSPASAAGRVFYVSRNGSNADGLSWASAWSELDRIDWSVVGPGDTIYIDGGSIACHSLAPGFNCGMVYNTSLSVRASGSAEQGPITISLSPEAGRNGTVIIDGGITSWSRCAQTAPEPPPPSAPGSGAPREVGVRLNDAQHVVIDGLKWGGIEIRNHIRYGLSFGGSQHVLARYLKVHHNTDPSRADNHAVGVTQSYRASHITLSRSSIFRNGQDAVRGAGDYFTLEENFIHSHYCGHPDGIQSFVPTSNNNVPDDAGQVIGTVIRRNFFLHIALQAIFLGENANHNSWNEDVLIHDNIFQGGAYMIKSKHGSSRNWQIYNNVFYDVSKQAIEWCCARPGAGGGMSIRDNIFMNVGGGGSSVYLPSAEPTSFTGNCVAASGHLSGNLAESGTIRADPLFQSPLHSHFQLSAGSPCAGKGASITSVPDLMLQTANGWPVQTGPR